MIVSAPSASRTGLDAEDSWKPMALRTTVCLAAGLAGWSWHEHSHSVSTAAYMVAYLFGGWDLARHTWEDLRKIRFDTHFLMLLCVPGAVAVGAWGEGAVLLFLFAASSTMEEFAAARTRREIGALLNRAPKEARQLVDGTERIVPVAALLPGDWIRVTAGDLVPLDFEVARGESACDESTLTGEAEPVRKKTGDTAMAGTLNQWGMLEGKVLRAEGDSTLQRIIRLVESAQRQKAPVQRFTDRFGSGYTAVVIAVCVGVFLFWWRRMGAPPVLSTDSIPSAFYRAMTLLVVLSPCALVLSVPSAILSAIAFGARHGVLFRGGAAIENLAGVDTVAFDKTGTLTEGKLRVVAVEVFRGDEMSVLGVARGLGGLSSHPMSRAVVQEIEQRGVAAIEIEGPETLPGRGIRGTLGGRRVALGNRGLAQETAGAPLPEPVGETSETWVAATDLLGRFSLEDSLRPETPKLIRKLHEEGLKTVMLTGDRAAIAGRIGGHAGVNRIMSELKPEDKLAEVQRLKAAGESVAMIGDGVNDAPVLAVADVAVAMGARGSDAAIEQADVVLMHDRLENFLLALHLSRRARRIIRQNLAISLGTIAVMALAALFWPGLRLAEGVAAHEGSTVVVVLNSLRLLWNTEKS